MLFKVVWKLVCDWWPSILSTNVPVDVIYVGMANAFDTVPHTVPQVLVLRPILFLLYITGNCLPDSIKTKIRTFADHSKI